MNANVLITIILILNAFFSGFYFLVITKHYRHDFFDPHYIFVVSWFLSFGIAPISVYVNGGNYSWFSYTETNLLFAIVFSWIIVLVTDILIRFSLKSSYRFKSTKINKIQTRTLWAFTLAAFIFMATSTYSKLSLGVNIAEIRYVSLESVGGSGLEQLPLFFISVYVVLLCVCRQRIHFYLLAVIWLPYSILTGSRAGVLTIALLYLWLKKDTWGPWKILVSTLVLFVFLFVLFILKTDTQWNDLKLRDLSLILSVVASTFDQVEWFSQSLSSDFLLRPILPTIEAVVFTYLPRALFSWKPASFGQMNFEYYLSGRDYPTEPVSGTYPVGIFTEFFMQFNVFSFLAFPLFIYFICRVYRSNRSDTAFAIVFQSAYLCSFGMFVNFSRGFSDTVGAFVFSFIIAFILYKLVTLKFSR